MKHGQKVKNFPFLFDLFGHGYKEPVHGRVFTDLMPWRHTLLSLPLPLSFLPLFLPSFPFPLSPSLPHFPLHLPLPLLIVQPGIKSLALP